MKIKIKVDASRIFAKNANNRCGKRGIWSEHEKKFYKMLQSLNGKTIDVETEHLFEDQFNTAPIKGVSENGMRIMAELVDEVIDDIRPNTLKCSYCWKCTQDLNINVCQKCNTTEYPLKIFVPSKKRQNVMVLKKRS